MRVIFQTLQDKSKLIENDILKSLLNRGIMATKELVKNLYEVVLALKANISDDDLEKNISQITSSIKNYGGNVIKVEDPVHRKFTHRMKGAKEGFYVSILFNSPPDVPNTLKRTLSIADDVLRYSLIRREDRE